MIFFYDVHFGSIQHKVCGLIIKSCSRNQETVVANDYDCNVVGLKTTTKAGVNWTSSVTKAYFHVNSALRVVQTRVCAFVCLFVWQLGREIQTKVRGLRNAVMKVTARNRLALSATDLLSSNPPTKRQLTPEWNNIWSLCSYILSQSTLLYRTI